MTNMSVPYAYFQQEIERLEVREEDANREIVKQMAISQTCREDAAYLRMAIKNQKGVDAEQLVA